jgi:predicted nucleic acid-binding protein
LSDVVLDSCSIINLHKGDALKVILSLSRHSFLVGAQVIEECGGRCEVLNAAIQDGRVKILDDSNIPAHEFFDLLSQSGLGDGETECLMHARRNTALLICSDGRAARAVATYAIGASRVIGSIRLLRHCVEDGLLCEDEAFAHYRTMKQRGAFLPPFTKDEFRDA